MAGGDTDTADNAVNDTTDNHYCRLCGAVLQQGAIASEQRACCLNATTIAGVCPEHGPLGPFYVVEEKSDVGLE